MHVRRCSQETLIGAEVVGLSLREPLDGATAARLREALFTHHVLAFREQHLSPGEQLAFARALGRVAAPEPSAGLTTHAEQHPELQWLAYRPPAGAAPVDRRPSQADTWHSDYAYLPDPPELSLLSAVELPEQGPDTLYVDMQQAYAALPEAWRARLLGLRAVHTQKGGLDPRLYRLPPYVVPGAVVDERLSPERSASHALVRRHPVSARPALFLTRCYAVGIEGLPPDEGRALIDELYAHVERAGATYRHVWRAGDCVLSDNVATNHRRSRPLDSARVLSRVMIRLT